MKKSLLYSKNVCYNRYLDEERICKKRLCHYLTYLVIDLMTLLTPPIRKMSLAAAKLKMQQAFDYWVQERIKLLAIFNCKKGL